MRHWAILLQVSAFATTGSSTTIFLLEKGDIHTQACLKSCDLRQNRMLKILATLYNLLHSYYLAGMKCAFHLLLNLPNPVTSAKLWHELSTLKITIDYCHGWSGLCLPLNLPTIKTQWSPQEYMRGVSQFLCQATWTCIQKMDPWIMTTQMTQIHLHNEMSPLRGSPLPFICDHLINFTCMYTHTYTHAYTTCACTQARAHTHIHTHMKRGHLHFCGQWSPLYHVHTYTHTHVHT